MNKQKAAVTLKKFISPNMKAKDYTGDSLKEAVTKAIEVLSDKTEYVKRSTHRKLVATLISDRARWMVKAIDRKAEIDTLQKHYDTLVADASEYRMKIAQLHKANKSLYIWRVVLVLLSAALLIVLLIEK